MSWFSPQNWAEVVQSVERAWSFNSRRLGVKADHAHLVCGHLSTRATLSGHLDDFAHHIIASNDGVHERYMAPGGDRWNAERPDDVTYFVCRDGNALVYMTRSGDIAVNPACQSASVRYQNAIRHIMPAMERLAEYAKRTHLFQEDWYELHA